MYFLSLIVQNVMKAVKTSAPAVQKGQGRGKDGDVKVPCRTGPGSLPFSSRLAPVFPVCRESRAAQEGGQLFSCCFLLQISRPVSRETSTDSLPRRLSPGSRREQK